MANKRVLVVDDSCLYQRLLTDVINAHDALEVVGVASNGKVALSMMEKLHPDVVTLDILMPEMDGIQTVIELRKRWPDVMTVMVSSITAEGSDAALDALALGASEHAAKPGPTGGIANIKSELTGDLLPKIVALCGLDNVAEVPGQSAPVIAPVRNPVRKSPVKGTRTRSKVKAQAIELVAIGISTGGPDALTTLLSELPADLSVPVVIVQHMPAEFTVKLAKRLNQCSALQVIEARLGDKLKAGTVYIAPGNYHMVLERIGGDVIVNLTGDEPENSCRPSVDPLFRSIPAIYEDKCLGVIMTGMGADGLNGCEALSLAGCPIIVQDEFSSIVWGMPKLVAMAGLAQQQVPLEQMAGVIMDIVNHPDLKGGRTAANADKHRRTPVKKILRGGQT